MNCSMTLKQKLLVAVLALTFLIFGTPASAAEQRMGTSFDHVQTGFPLLGAHAQTDCQTCHLQGVFKGTPRQCEYCHTQGSRIASTFKTTGHPQTLMPCSQCHSSQVSWTGARFDHIGVTPGSCATCHNGVTATGKPVKHVVTSAPCDDCHRTTAWLPAGYDHFGVKPGTCTTCHGVNATGKPNGHVTTSSQCDVCHTTGAWKPAAVDHANPTVVVTHQCATCHGLTAKAKKDGHIPTSLSCDYCHDKAPLLFKPSTFSHKLDQGVVAGQCITCHNGSYTSSSAWGKNQTTQHMPTSLSCDLCHSSTLPDFNTSTFTHSPGQGVVAGQCATCHNGSYAGAPFNADGKPSTNHVVTTLACDQCHITTAWSPAGYDHFGVKPGTCTSCHGVNATGKPNGHVTTSSQCDTCHSTTAWKPAGVDHTTVSVGQCATCHGLTATAKKDGHIPTTLSCDACHNRAPLHFKPSTFSHKLDQGVVAGQCITCHNGSYTSSSAWGKNQTTQHMPTSLSCDLCHSSTLPDFNTSTFTHSPGQGVVAGQCVTCHNGSYAGAPFKADGKPSKNHVVTTLACDQCHRTTAWSPAGYDHTGIVAPCSTCHDGVTATAKKSGHVATTLECGACHVTTAWKPAGYDHTGVVTGACNSCHNGTQAIGQSNGQATPHIPTSALSCDACHLHPPTRLDFKKPTTFKHLANQNVAPGGCVTCHNGNYYPIAYGMAKTKNAAAYNHFTPLTGTCDTCHTSYSSFSTYTFTHASQGIVLATTVCSTCHDDTHTFGNLQLEGWHHGDEHKNSLPNKGVCGPCHTNFTSWKNPKGNKALPTRHPTRIPQRTPGPIRK